jgi:hypothetical protein
MMRKIYCLLSFALLSIFNINCQGKDENIPEGVEMKVSGVQNISENYSFILNSEYIRVRRGHELIFTDKTNHVLFRVVEILYSVESKEDCIRDMQSEIPTNADVIHEIRNGIDYYGYYEWIKVKDGEGPSFIGNVFGKRSNLYIEFSFEDMKYLDTAKEIWMSIKER